MRVGVVGFGYWGGNVVRNFLAHRAVKSVTVCDHHLERLEKAQSLFPSVRTVQYLDDLLKDPDIDTIAVVTPIQTHFEIAKAALTRKKHVLVEKTITESADQALELVRLAKRNQVTLAVDHTFVHSPVVQKIRQLLKRGALGDLWYYDSVRINLGLFQHDVNVLWDLATHDLSILLHLMEERPVEVSTQGANRAGGDFEDIAYVTLKYESGFICHFHVNWLAPTKVRQILIGGSERMLIWDDLNAAEKLRIYDKGIEVKKNHGLTPEAYHDMLIRYRLGDMHAPALETSEPLTNLVSDFVRCVREKDKPLSSGEDGLEVVTILEAARASMARNGQGVPVVFPKI
jgi:predicted dehydrogenase